MKRRILAALDASMSFSTLDAVVDLAVHLEGEVEALFVEDARLLGMASLPFTRQLTLHGTEASLDSESLEADVRARGIRVRAQLADLAARRSVRWTFAVVRGDLAHEVASASDRADLVVIEASAAPLFGRLRLHSATRRVVDSAPSSVLVVPPGAPKQGHVVVFLDRDDEEARRVLGAAFDLATRYGSAVEVHTASGVEPSVRKHLDLLAEAQSKLRTRQLDISADLSATLMRRVLAEDTGTVVLSAGSSLLASEDVWEKIAKARVRVLLVR